MASSSKFDAEKRRLLHEMAMRNLAEMTDEEDRAITEDAMRDPDNPPLEDAAEFMTWDEYLGKYHGKTTVVLDRDIVERFRNTGEDWEERINIALRSVAPAE